MRYTIVNLIRGSIVKSRMSSVVVVKGVRGGEALAQGRAAVKRVQVMVGCTPKRLDSWAAVSSF